MNNFVKITAEYLLITKIKSLTYKNSVYTFPRKQKFQIFQNFISKVDAFIQKCNLYRDDRIADGS